MRNPAKSTTPRRVTPTQTAAATAVGISGSDVHDLVTDDSTIVVRENKNMKGNPAGTYRVVCENADGSIKYIDDTVYTSGTKAANKGREQWPAASIDEGKAAMLFFERAVSLFNDFADRKGNKRLGTIAFLEMVTKSTLHLVEDADA